MKTNLIYLLAGVGICVFWLIIFFMAWYVGNEVLK